MKIEILVLVWFRHTYLASYLPRVIETARLSKAYQELKLRVVGSSSVSHLSIIGGQI